MKTSKNFKINKSDLTAFCPICESAKYQLDGIGRSSSTVAELLRHEYQVLKCSDCSFYYVYPEIDFSKEEWANLYTNEYFEPAMTKWWSKKRASDRKQRLDWLEQTISPDKIRDFLEIGCGQGFVLVDALTRGWRVHGTDIQDNRIDLAKNDAISFVKGELLKIGFDNDSFDSIYMDSILEHVQHPVMYLEEIRRILRPGGVLYVGVPNEASLANDVKEIIFRGFQRKDISVRLKPFVSPYHINGFTKTSLKKAFQKAGFKIVIFRNFAGHYDWLKHRAFSRPFFIGLGLLPFHLLAILLRKQVYLEAVVVKPVK